MGAKNMGKFLLDIPEDLHDKLRHKSIDEKKEIRELLIIAIKYYLKIK